MLGVACNSHFADSAGNIAAGAIKTNILFCTFISVLLFLERSLKVKKIVSCNRHNATFFKRVTCPLLFQL